MHVFPGRSRGLTLTGERTLPGIWHENYWFRRHEVAYLHVAPLTKGRSVLEAGCGEGYGAAALLAAGATSVVAVDYDESATAHVNAAYSGVAVVRGNLVALPLRDNCFDAVISLQTVEHLWDQPAYAAECARVLRPGGLLAVSTPNRLTFSPGVGRGQRPLNPFHVNEFDPEELMDLLAPHVDGVEVLGVHHGPRIAAHEARHGGVVAAQLAAPHDAWDDPLTALVHEVTAADFAVLPDSPHAPLDRALDLLAVGRRR